MFQVSLQATVNNKQNSTENSFTNYTVSQKNDTDVAHYNFNAN